MLRKLAMLLGLGSTIIGLSTAPAAAGPFIFAGTDADDHGSATATANLDGWLFMQKAIENLGAGVTNGNKVVVSLGSDPGTQAGNAARSAFNFSNLASSGWTFLSVNGAAAITSFFMSGISSAGIIMLDSGGIGSTDNVTGGITGSEEAVVTSNATTINSYLGSGGGLFSQANSYGFLSTLVPGVVVSSESNTGIQLTADGSAAFPALTNADLSAGPYHERFSNFGAIPVLGTSTSTSNAIIIGASGGTITNPTNPTGVPEPGTMALLGGIALAGIAMRRGQRS